MSNIFTLQQALDRAGERVIEGYEVEHVVFFEKDGKPMYTFDMEDVGEPSYTFDGTQMFELVHGEADLVDVEGKKVRVAFYETIPLANNTQPLPE